MRMRAPPANPNSNLVSATMIPRAAAFLAAEPAAFVPGEVHVVALPGLGGGGEERFGEAGGLREAAGERVAADGPAGLVFLPGSAREIAAHDAFDGKGLRFSNDHGAA